MEFTFYFHIFFAKTHKLYEDYKEKQSSILGAYFHDEEEAFLQSLYNENEHEQDEFSFLKDEFEKEYNENILKGIYFLGSPLSMFENQYAQSKNDYLKRYIDATELDFINSELLKMKTFLDNEIEHFSFLFHEETKQNFIYSTKKTIDFLEQKVLNITKKKDTSASTLKWHGTQTELIELTKSLIENGNLKGTQKDIFNTVQKIFDFELKGIDSKINSFVNARNPENLTKFIDTLKKALLDSINKKTEKNR